MSDLSIKKKDYTTIATILARIVLVIFLYLNLGGLVIFLAIGTWKFWSAIGVYFGSNTEEASAAALKAGTGGLEFFLLSALGFLMIRCLAEYFEDFEDPSKPSNGSKIKLTEVKALSIGLLFAITATHLVGELITGTIKNDTIIAGSILLVLLGAFFFGLEHVVDKHASAANHKDSADDARH